MGRKWRGRSRKGTKAMRDTAYKVVNDVLKKRAEVKYTNTQFTDRVDNNNTSQVIRLGVVGEGLNDSQRIGNTINVISYDLRMKMEMSDPGFNAIRYCIVHTFDDITSPSDIFDPVVFTAMGNIGINCPFNRGVVRRCLLDKTYLLNQYASGTPVPGTAAQVISAKFKNHYLKQRNKLTYLEPPSTVNIPQERYYLVLLSDSVSLVGGHPSIRCNLKMRYTDM